MYCHQCGTSADAGALFCSKCGALLKNQDSIRQAVTPEPPRANVEDADGRARTELAARGTRLGAAALDILIAIACLIPGVAVMSFSDSDGGKLFGGALIAAGFLGLLIVQTVLLVKRGQSVGKRALGIKIVKVSDESVPGFAKVVLLRMWVPGLIAGIPYVGVFLGLVDCVFIFRDDRRCLHDLIAETKVIKSGLQEQGQESTLSESSADQVPDVNEAIAQNRASRKMGWYSHAFIYLAANIGLAVAANLSGRHVAWFLPLAWGLGLLVHWLIVFVVSPNGEFRENLIAEERKRIEERFHEDLVAQDAKRPDQRQRGE